MVKIEYNKEACIGCGACAAQCPDNWEIVEEEGQYKAKLKNKEPAELGCNQDATDSCPVNAIKILK